MKKRKASFSRSFDYMVTFLVNRKQSYRHKTGNEITSLMRIEYFSEILQEKLRKRAWNITYVQNRTKEVSRSELQWLLERAPLPIVFFCLLILFFFLFYFMDLLGHTIAQIYSDIVSAHSQQKMNQHKFKRIYSCSWFVESFVNI